MKNVTKVSLFSISVLCLSLFMLEGKKHKGEGLADAAVPAQQNPEELGDVHWLRDLDAGKAAAEKSGKPMLILFQEVPGCSNCTRFGNTTLSDPLIVEAIEYCFVPVCIYNNKGGKDGAALKRFDEPSWNNPVVRIVGADYQDIVARMPDFNAPSQLLKGMVRALEQTNAAVPLYLKLLEEEHSARESGLETAVFKMYCFWSGEVAFGNLPGVIETEPGYQNGAEVVRVRFDPTVVNKADLEAQTKPKGISACAKNEGFSNDKDLKYYLAHSDYAYVPMTSLQACRANSLIGSEQSPDPVLSPRQLELYRQLKIKPKRELKSMVGRKDLAVAWKSLN